MCIVSHLQPPQKPAHNDYEVIRPSYKITSPATRPAPKPPVPFKSNGTLGAHSDVEGVPFVLNPNLSNTNSALEVIEQKYLLCYRTSAFKFNQSG